MLSSIIMNALVLSTLLSLSTSIWAAPGSVDLRNQNEDPRLVWNIFTTGEVSSHEAAGLKKIRQIDLNDLLPSDKEGLVPDVYWRTWKGTIPKDAVVGAYGQTDCGSDVPIYMAQVFHKASADSGILPAQILRKSKAVSVSYGMKEFRYKDNIKILCADDPSILTWVPVDETKEFGLTEEDCVVAGAERTFNTFFGKTKYEDETVIGKVVFYSKNMYFPYYGEEKYLTKDYEILCYKKAVETKRIEALKRKEEEQGEKKKESNSKETTKTIDLGTYRPSEPQESRPEEPALYYRPFINYK